MVNTVIDKTLLFFRDRGFDASNRIQESVHNDQVIILLEDISSEIESQHSYFVEVQLSVNYVSDDPDNIIETFMSYPFELEQTLRDDTSLSEILVLEVGSPELQRIGRVYALSMPIVYKQQKII